MRQGISTKEGQVRFSGGDILKRARQGKGENFKREVIGGKSHEIACQSIWDLSNQFFLYIGQEYFFSIRL